MNIQHNHIAATDAIAHAHDTYSPSLALQSINHLALQLVHVSAVVVSSVILEEVREVVVQVERAISVCIEGKCDLA